MENEKPIYKIATAKVYNGYEQLFGILAEALNQSQLGKGRERHANGNAFEDQPIVTEIAALSQGDHLALEAAIYQVRKKARESARLLIVKGPDAAIAEIMGAIVYSAAMIVAIKKKFNIEDDSDKYFKAIGWGNQQ